jgi:hypothetical protein
LQAPIVPHPARGAGAFAFSERRGDKKTQEILIPIKAKPLVRAYIS